MEVLTAVLCDSAADYNGKLCILGAFDTIRAAQFPAKHGSCAIALRMLFHHEDIGEHKFSLKMIDPDGRSVFPNDGPSFTFHCKEIPEGSFFLSRNLVINLQGLPLPSPAQYSFDLQHNDGMLARIPLQVVEDPRLPSPGQHRPPEDEA